jgi:hypothetical protein
MQLLWPSIAEKFKLHPVARRVQNSCVFCGVAPKVER